MIRILALAWLALAALVLAGCLSAEAVYKQRYTLTPAYANQPAAKAGTQDRARAPDGKILRIAQIRAPLWLRSTQMFYRLAYRQDAKVMSYTHSTWLAPPAVLLHGLLRESLAGMPGFAAVLGPDSRAGAALTLRLDLNHFIQVFAARNESVGVLDATASLYADGLLAQREFHIAVPAPEPGAGGGVAALNRAARQLVARVRAWTLAQTRVRSAETAGPSP